MNRAIGVVAAAVLAWWAAGAAAGDAPKPLPDDIVAAWQGPQGSAGWMGLKEFGDIQFRNEARRARGGGKCPRSRCRRRGRAS